jgi:small subunit ribosomal protein S13
MRIEGVTIPDDKQIQIALTSVYGIGRSRAQTILNDADIDHSTYPENLTEAEEKQLRSEIENYTLEGDLRRQEEASVKRLKDIECYRGIRHTKNLPVRGQNTQSNSRTNRPYEGYKTAGSGNTTKELK